jgi:hypothetical protein
MPGEHRVGGLIHTGSNDLAKAGFVKPQRHGSGNGPRCVPYRR